MTTKDTSQLTNTKVSGQTIHDSKQSLNRYKELCEFDYELTDSTQQIQLFGRDSKGIRLTYKVKDTDGFYNAIRYKEITDTWLIDLATSIIDEETFTGGILDSSTPDFGSDYLVWAFFDDTGAIFRGFGATRRPSVVYTGTTAVIGIVGDKGSTTRFDLTGTGNNNGLYFVIGSEVQIYNGIIETAEYNHGIVIETSSLFVDILLDNSTQYGSINIPSTPGQIFQNTNLKPLKSDGTLFGKYNKYICNLQISNNLDILNVRRKGGRYFFIQDLRVDNTSHPAGINIVLIAALRFLPKHSLDGIMQFEIALGNNAAFALGPEDGNATFLQQNRPNKSIWTHSTVSYNRYTKNWVGTKSGGSTSNDLAVYVQGYNGENEF